MIPTAKEAAAAAHPETFRTCIVRPGHDGVPELTTTPSSNIQGIGFSGGALFVQFQGGKVYRYTEVDSAAGLAVHHGALLTAESRGSYFAKHLRNNPLIACTYLGRCADPVVPVDFHENGDGV